MDSCNQEIKKSTAEPIDFLKAYVSKKGPDFGYQISDSIVKKEYKLNHIKMTSGRWLTEEEVIQTLRWQWLDVVVPHNLETSTVRCLQVGCQPMITRFY